MRPGTWVSELRGKGEKANRWRIEKSMKRMHEGRSKNHGFLSRLLDGVVWLRRSDLRTKIPRPLRTLGYKLLPQKRLKEKTWRAEYEDRLANVKRAPIQTDVTLGIIKDCMYKYGNYEAACMELGVPYRLIDITGPDWIQRIKESGCAGFLVWPSASNSVEKTMWDERLRVLTDDMSRTLFPSYEALWLYESKRRMNDWLEVRDMPHPRTWVFFRQQAALKFAETAQLPVVFKTDLGSTAYGVEIVRSRRRALKLVGKCFGRGYLSYRHDSRDRAWGCILFQEYIPDACEWRMVRIGDSFFGHRKLKKGQFHSGSKKVAWDRPPDGLLDLVCRVTEAGPFLSMDVDVLEDPQGRYYINELQAVFGQKHAEQMWVHGRPGRFVFEEGIWTFEEGHFCQNCMSNERVRVFLRLLGAPVPPQATP